MIPGFHPGLPLHCHYVAILHPTQCQRIAATGVSGKDVIPSHRIASTWQPCVAHNANAIQSRGCPAGHRLDRSRVHRRCARMEQIYYDWRPARTPVIGYTTIVLITSVRPDAIPSRRTPPGTPPHSYGVPGYYITDVLPDVIPPTAFAYVAVNGQDKWILRKRIHIDKRKKGTDVF